VTGEAEGLGLLTGLEGRLAAMTEMLRAGRADGPVVGEGPLARAGLSHVLFSDGGVGVGITRMQVTNALWSEPTTIGAYHHVVYPYTPVSVSFEGAGYYVVTPTRSSASLRARYIGAGSFTAARSCRSLRRSILPRVTWSGLARSARPCRRWWPACPRGCP
jgi:hypothetical protein